MVLYCFFKENATSGALGEVVVQENLCFRKTPGNLWGEEADGRGGNFN